mmetsp:Transcript_162977/g.522644  ORF Transcript_162977/g.522644 Transcript_162977/m.522644 type:complete len:201 (+) Transcript_162977:753-1355(+)
MAQTTRPACRHSSWSSAGSVHKLASWQTSRLPRVSSLTLSCDPCSTSSISTLVEGWPSRLRAARGNQVMVPGAFTKHSAEFFFPPRTLITRTCCPTASLRFWSSLSFNSAIRQASDMALSHFSATCKLEPTSMCANLPRNSACCWGVITTLSSAPAFSPTTSGTYLTKRPRSANQVCSMSQLANFILASFGLSTPFNNLS